MAVEKQSEEKIKIPKQDLFNDYKAAHGALFGSKTYADVEDIREDPFDTSFIEIVFKEV